MKLRKLLTVMLISSFILTGCSTNTTYISNANNIEIVSQLNTGRYSDINCGAAAISMVNKYINNEVIELEEINNKLPPTQLYGYDTNEMQALLNYYNLPFELVSLTDNDSVDEIQDNIIKYIDNSNILLLCINKKYVPKNIRAEDTDSKNFFVKINSTYDGIENHYVICTGYKIYNNEIYFEIYDSLEDSVRYFDSSLLTAIKNNWEFSFIF